MKNSLIMFALIACFGTAFAQTTQTNGAVTGGAGAVTATGGSGLTITGAGNNTTFGGASLGAGAIVGGQGGLGGAGGLSSATATGGLGGTATGGQGGLGGVSSSSTTQHQQATSDATNAGNQQSTTYAPVTNVAASDLKDQGATAADIQAKAAIEIAKLQVGAAGTRDLSADQKAALDREAAITIAKINADQKIRNTPSVNGPPLVSSNDTCMGSASGAINAPGIGIALGKTYTDENCMMLKNSRELWNMGMKAASLALMCNDSANREALELTGFECPQTTKAKREAQAKMGPADGPVELRMSESLASPPVEYTGNDPIVRARLGLK